VRIATGVLRERAERLARRLRACDLCPRRCGVDRTIGETGFCGVGPEALLAAALPHFGEEPPLSGVRGAGTVFFGGCNLRCVYCQNYQISHLLLPPREVDARKLADELLLLQRQGCHNIEFVTPAHVVPQLLAALTLAAEAGLDLPVVYNSGGYDSPDVLRELDGVVDVYLPDLKYAGREEADSLSRAPDYWDVARRAITEMVRQVGALEVDDDGIARRGVIVRHLILPNDLAGSREVLEFVAALEPRPALSLMAQFHPVPVCDHPLLQRPLFEAEYRRVCGLLDQLGFEGGWVQDLSAESVYRPDFSRRDPFRESCGEAE
jgi:putative pyruvate formate lyase activating enzyme